MKKVENLEKVKISDMLDNVRLEIMENKSGIFTDKEADYLAKKYSWLVVSDYKKPKRIAKRKFSKSRKVKSVKKTRTTKKKHVKK